MVHRHELDVALAEAPVTGADIVVVPWRTDTMVVITSPNHRLVGTAVRPDDLADELFVLREPESGTRAIVLQGLEKAGLEPRRVMSVDGTEVIKQIVAEGLGIGVVSRFAVGPELEAGALVALDVRALKIQRPFNRLALEKASPSTAARAFLSLIETPELRSHRAARTRI